MDDQHETIIPNYYCVAGYKKTKHIQYKYKTAIYFLYNLSKLGKKISRLNLKFYSYFYQKTVFDISCKLSPGQFARNVKSCFQKKIKNVINLLSASFAHRVVKVKQTRYT